ncbi:MAG: hypothetical protein M3530_11850 [Thermoproteota archaeon]|nr:hypothetical protein [Thermoproteota archaeon]
MGSIGSSEVEQEVQKRVETVTKNFIDKMQRDTGDPTSLDDEIKEYIQMVIKEAVVIDYIWLFVNQI